MSDRTLDLIEAIKTGAAGQVQTVLEAEPALLGTRSDGVSAILLAMYYRHPEIARIFLDCGAELDIFEAAAMGEARRVELLVEGRPELVRSFSPDGFSPLGFAAFFGHRAVVQYLVSRGAEINAVSRNALRVAPLHSAIARGDTAIAGYLLDHGADVNMPQQQGFTPLHGAAGSGNEEIVRLLLERGGNRAALTEDGKTPAQVAAEHEHAGLAQMLQL